MITQEKLRQNGGAQLLYQAIKKRRVIFFLVLALAVLVGVVAASGKKATYIATALVVTGQYIWISGSDIAVNERVEPVAVIQARIPNLRLGIQSSSPSEQALMQQSLVLKTLPDSKMFLLKVRSTSHNGARDALLSVINKLGAIHSSMMEPTLIRERRQLAIINQALKESKNILRNCSLLWQGASYNPKYTGKADNLCFEGARMKYLQASLEEALDEKRSYTTHIEGDITVDVIPTPWMLTIGVAFLMGLMLSTLTVAFLERAVLRQLNDEGANEPAMQMTHGHLHGNQSINEN